MKKALSVLLTFLLIVAITPLGTFSFAVNAVSSGTTGECSWSLNGTVLIISGNGDMEDYDSFNPAPWGINITEVVIENGVTSIGACAFLNCTKLTSVTISKSVEDVGAGAFLLCVSLAEINVDPGNTYYSEIDGVLFNKDATILIQYPLGNTRTRYSIPVGTESIANNAFSWCDYLYDVKIPQGVKTIGNCAFADCFSLSYITIPDSVINIGIDAFSNTSYYNTKSNWNNNVLYINNHLIRAKSTISGDCIIKDGTLTVAGNAFLYCEDLTDVKFPDSLLTIGNSAFIGCSSLVDITLPDNLAVVDDYAFYSCSNLASVTIPLSVETIGENAFMGCSDLTIKGYTNSYAKEYARKNGIPFVALDAPEYIVGDINTDGDINNKDLGVLMQYLNGWQVEIKFDAADVNMDVTINNKDYGLLMQYVNGWDVELGGVF